MDAERLEEVVADVADPRASEPGARVLDREPGAVVGGEPATVDA